MFCNALEKSWAFCRCLYEIRPNNRSLGRRQTFSREIYAGKGPDFMPVSLGKKAYQTKNRSNPPHATTATHDIKRSNRNLQANT